jgi:Tfp pilus assembly protein PilN
MNGGITTLLFSVAGVLILGLCSILWWFIRDRMKTRERKEDLLERRLSSGAQTMQSIATEVKNIQTMQIKQAADYVLRQDFNGYRKEQEEKLEKLWRNLDEMKIGQGDLKTALAQMGTRLESGMKSMADMLAKVIKIPTDPGDK